MATVEGATRPPAQPWLSPRRAPPALPSACATRSSVRRSEQDLRQRRSRDRDLSRPAMTATAALLPGLLLLLASGPTAQGERPPLAPPPAERRDVARRSARLRSARLRSVSRARFSIHPVRTGGCRVPPNPKARRKGVSRRAPQPLGPLREDWGVPGGWGGPGGRPPSSPLAARHKWRSETGAGAALGGRRREGDARVCGRQGSGGTSLGLGEGTGAGGLRCGRGSPLFPPDSSCAAFL